MNFAFLIYCIDVLSSDGGMAILGVLLLVCVLCVKFFERCSGSIQYTYQRSLIGVWFTLSGDLLKHSGGGKGGLWQLVRVDSDGDFYIRSVEGCNERFHPRHFKLLIPTEPLSEEQKTLLPQSKLLYTIAALMIVYGMFMPNKSTSYKMLAAVGVEQAANNPDVQKFAGKSLEVLEKYMTDYLKEDKVKEK